MSLHNVFVRYIDFVRAFGVKTKEGEEQDKWEDGFDRSSSPDGMYSVALEMRSQIMTMPFVRDM